MTVRDIAWAAGFLEGDGHFGWHHDGRFRRADGSFGKKWGQPIVVADQVYREPLDKLRSIFNMGKVYGPYASASGRGKYRWELSSNQAAAVMLTLWTFMSSIKREQIETAISRWKLTPSAGGDRRKAQEKKDS